MKKNSDDDIKVVVMNPEAIPVAQERLFQFFYERYMQENSKENHKEAE